MYGAYDGAPLELHYSEDWSPCEDRTYAYCLQAEPVDTDVPGLAKVSVRLEESGSELFAIEVAWQEVLS